MPLSRNISAYDDVRTILVKVLSANKPATYTLASPGQAKYWVQRANKFRQLASLAAARQSGSKDLARTQFDAMGIRFEMSTVHLTPVKDIEGQLMIDGEAVEVKTETPSLADQASNAASTAPASSDLLQAALDLNALKSI